jgi:hypothetical protein
MNPWTNLVGPILIVLTASVVGKYVLDQYLDYRLRRKAMEADLEAVRLEMEILRRDPLEWADEWAEYIQNLPDVDDAE